MNAADLVRNLLETEEDFDPRDYVLRGGDESAREIYRNKYVRVFIPLTFHTFQDYIANGSLRQIRFDGPLDKAQFDTYVQQNGPIYMAVDKVRSSQRHVGVLINFKKGWVAALSTGATASFKEIGQIMCDAAMEGLRKGLGNYFIRQAKRNPKDAVQALIRLGRYDDAAKFGHHARLADVPMGDRFGVVKARDKAKLRTNNRFSRLMHAQANVIFKNEGFYLLFNDYDELLPFFDKDCRDTVEKVFSHGLEFNCWEGNAAEDAIGDANEANLAVIRQLLVGRTVVSSDFEFEPLTRQDTAGLLSGDIRDLLKEQDNEDVLEDIRDALHRAACNAEESGYESAYWEKVQNAIEGTLCVGNPVWMAHPTARDKEGKPKQMLGCFFTYDTLNEWLRLWSEDNYGEQFEDGQILDLAYEYIEKLNVDFDHVSPDTDTEYFNQTLADNLSEIDPISPEENVPVGQANFGFDDQRKEVEIEHPHTVTLDRQEGDPEGSEYPKAYKHVPEPEARKYAAVVPRARVTAESIVAALLEDKL